MARPSSFTPDLAKRICAEIATGLSLNTICKQKDYPCIATVMNWLVRGEIETVGEYRQFLENYTRAREVQADVIFDECLEIADNAIALNEDIAKARLRIDTRKWMAGKLRPKKYNDKLILEGNEDSPVKHSIDVRFID